MLLGVLFSLDRSLSPAQRQCPIDNQRIAVCREGVSKMFTLFWFCTRALTAGLVWLIPALAGIGLSKPATPASAGTTAVGMNRRAQHVKSGRLTDIVQVIRVIDGANASLKQGEFEPTVAFEARKRQVLPTRRSFAFVCKGEGNLFRYNPDELIMTVMLQPIERSLSLPDTYSSRHLLSLVLDTRNWMFRELLA
jgi:hypothetical protein